MSSNRVPFKVSETWVRSKISVNWWITQPVFYWANYSFRKWLTLVDYAIKLMLICIKHTKLSVTDWFESSNSHNPYFWWIISCKIGHIFWNYLRSASMQWEMILGWPFSVACYYCIWYPHSYNSRPASQSIWWIWNKGYFNKLIHQQQDNLR